jgi:hypothetical protein
VHVPRRLIYVSCGFLAFKVHSQQFSRFNRRACGLILVTDIFFISQRDCERLTSEGGWVLLHAEVGANSVDRLAIESFYLFFFLIIIFFYY